MNEEQRLLERINRLEVEIIKIKSHIPGLEPWRKEVIIWQCSKCGTIFRDSDCQEICGSDLTYYCCPNSECEADSSNWKVIKDEKRI